MQSVVSSSSGDRGRSLVSMVFPAVGGKPEPAVELSPTVFNEAQGADAKVEVQLCADRLQRPEGEEKKKVRLLLPHRLLTSVHQMNCKTFCCGRAINSTFHSLALGGYL